MFDKERMDELEKWKDELWKALVTMDKTKYYLKDRLMYHIFDIDFEEITDALKHLLGFIDCMIKFKIELLPEQ